MKPIKLLKLDLMQPEKHEWVYVDPLLIACMRISHIQGFVVRDGKKSFPCNITHSIITVDGKEIAVRQSVGDICFLIAQSVQLDIVDYLGIKLDGDLLDFDAHISNDLDDNKICLCGKGSDYERSKPFATKPPIH